MDKYFANINNNQVGNVIIASDEFISGLPGFWLECGGNSNRRLCSVNWNYSNITDDFYPPQPYPSWTLDNNYEWQPPIPYPPAKDQYDDNYYDWDEDKLQWVLHTPIDYTAYRTGMFLEIGLRFTYNGKIYKVNQSHTTQANWSPDKVPALYTEVLAPGAVGEWVQPTGAHDAYQKDDRVYYNGLLWKSTINNNVWAPGVYGWIKI